MQSILKAVFARLQSSSNTKQLPAKPHFNSEGMPVSLDRSIYKDIYGRAVPDAEQQFYPPKPVGLSVFQEEAILDRYQDLIGQLEKTVKIGKHRKAKDGRGLFEARYVDVIFRLASYAHMLPASEYHHHSQPGGLFRHSLESALFAVQQADNFLPPTTGAVDLDEQRRPRYLYATWVGALMHDTGKLITDLRVYPHTVYDKEKDQSISILDWNKRVSPWVPHLSTLTEWARSNSVDRYMVHFRERSHKQHDNSSVILLSSILKGEGLEYIMDSPDNLYGLLHDALSGYAHDKDYLSNMIRYGDSLSTSNDMKYIATASFGIVKKSKMLNIVNLIRALRHQWTFNDTKAQAWVIGEAVFLRWESSFHSVLKSAKEQRVDDIPQDTNTLLLMMEDHGITRWYDKNNRSVLFAQGNFEAKDVLAIAEGRHEVQWAELIQVVAKEWVFDSDPLPGNARGVLFLQATNEFFLCFENGVVKPVDLHAKNAKTPIENTKQPETAKKTKPKATKTEATPAKKQPKQTKAKNKGINFVNGPDQSGSATANSKEEPKQQMDAQKSEKQPAQKAQDKTPKQNDTGKISATSKPESTAAPATNQESNESTWEQAERPAKELTEIERLVTLVKDDVQAVNNTKLAIDAVALSKKWEMDIESTGKLLQQHGLLKIRLGSNEMTFKGVGSTGTESVFFALTPKFHTLAVRTVEVSDGQPSAPAKAKPNEAKSKKSTKKTKPPTSNTLSTKPESSSDKETNQKSTRKVTEQLQNKTLREMIERCPENTLGHRFKQIIIPENYSKLLRLSGDTITFDLIEIMNNQARDSGYPLRDNIDKVYREIEKNPLAVKPESSTVFSMALQIPSKLLAEIKV